jgi:excisionase family DNA binding protein
VNLPVPETDGMARNGAASARSSAEPLPDRLLIADEAAELLALPVSWVREATRQGNLPHVKLGRYRRYVRADLEKWIEGHKA